MECALEAVTGKLLPKQSCTNWEMDCVPQQEQIQNGEQDSVS